MSVEKRELRQAIEEQDVARLETLLAQYPETDLNSFTQNNLSALWLALSHKKPSKRVIEALIRTNRVDPNQLYMGITLAAYTLYRPSCDSEILQLLRNYENNYQPDRRNQQAPDRDIQDLRDFVYGQNVHNSVVEDSVKRAGSLLHARYVKSDEFDWLKPLEEIEDWLGLDGYNLSFELPQDKNYDENTLYFTLEDKKLTYFCIDQRTKETKKGTILKGANWEDPLTINQLRPHFSTILRNLRQNIALKSLKSELNASLSSIGIKEEIQPKINVEQATLKSLARIKGLEGSYQCSKNCVLDCKKALALAWLGLTSPNPDDFVEQIDMSSDEVRSRKKLVIATLIKIQNEYGFDNPSCVKGSFNHLISSLDCIHIDVRISDSTPLTQELINYKYLSFCKTKLTTVLRDSPAFFWEYMQFYYLNIPGLPINEASPVNKFTQFTQKTVDEFKESIRTENKFLKDEDDRTGRTPPRCMEESLLEKALQDSTLTDDEGLVGESGLAVANLPAWTSIDFFYHHINYTSFGFGKEMDLTIKRSMNRKMLDLIAQNPQDLDKVFSDLGAELAACPIDISCIEKHLTPSSKLYGDFFNTIDQNKKEELLKRVWTNHAKTLPRGLGTVKDEDPLFWQLLHEDFEAAIPELKDWFNNLPEELQKEFIRLLIAKNYHQDYSQCTREIKSLALDLSLTHGYLKQFPLDEPLTLENRDLKGIDLSQLNLQLITFINCDLALTNILDNKSFEPLRHIKSNRFDGQIVKIIEDLSLDGYKHKQLISDWIRGSLEKDSNESLFRFIQFLSFSGHLKLVSFVLDHFQIENFQSNNINILRVLLITHRSVGTTNSKIQILNLIERLLRHENIKVDLYTTANGKQYNPFNGVSPQSSYDVFRALFTPKSPSLSLDDLKLIRSQFREACRSVFDNFVSYTETESFLCDDDDCEFLSQSWAGNERAISELVFSNRFNEHFNKIKEKQPKLVQDCFKYLITKTCGLNDLALDLRTLLKHPYCNSDNLSFLLNPEEDYKCDRYCDQKKSRVLHEICSNSDLKSTYLADHLLSELTKKLLKESTLYLVDFKTLPQAWRDSYLENFEFIYRLDHFHIDSREVLQNLTKTILEKKEIYANPEELEKSILELLHCHPWQANFEAFTKLANKVYLSESPEAKAVGIAMMFFGVSLMITSLILGIVILAGTFGLGTPIALGIGFGGVALGATNTYGGHRFFKAGALQNMASDMEELRSLVESSYPIQ